MPTPAGSPANVTRNIVFQEVLEGVRQAVPVSETPATTTKEVEDITDWIDYEAIEVEMENTLDEDAVAEEGPISQAETQRRVEARRRVPPTKQKQPRREVSTPRAWPEVDEPLCEYEKIRQCNMEEINTAFYQQFGYHIREARSTVRGVLGHEEVDSESGEEDEQV